MAVEYKGYLIPEAELTEVLEKFGKSAVDVVAEEWASTLKAAKDVIVKSVESRFSDAAAYRDIMLNRAKPKLEQVFNPNWPGYRNALLKFAAKQSKPETYQKWRTNFEGAMQNIFDARVDAGRDSWKSNAMIVLRTVGIKQVKLGPARKLHMIILGDTKVTRLLDPNLDSLTGTVEYYLDPALPKQVAQAVIPVIVETITYASYFHAAGDATSRDTVLREGSDALKNLLSKILDGTKVNIANLVAEIRFDENRGDFYVHVNFPAA